MRLFAAARLSRLGQRLERLHRLELPRHQVERASGCWLSTASTCSVEKPWSFR